MAYTPIKTNNLEDVKLSYTTKQTFDILNNNASELDDRADKADAKFETIEPIVEDAVTYGAQTKTDAQKEQARTNIGAYAASNPNGYTTNQGTVTSVGAGTGLSISGTATVNPTVNVASDHKLLTTTEYNTINTNIGTAQQKADDAYALAEGRENATSYTNYQAMVTALNAETAPTLKVGDNIYIETVGVPDLWVSDVLDSKASYTYTTDQAIVDALNDPSVGYINIGWYRLDELETAKVDLSDYVEKTTTVTGTGALGGGGALSQNRTITHNAGSAPNVASGLYKISTDAYSHVSGTTAVATADLTPLLDGSYLAKNNPTGSGKVQIGSGVVAGGENSVAFGGALYYGTCLLSSASANATTYALTSISGQPSHIKANDTVIYYNDNGTVRYALVTSASISGTTVTVTTDGILSSTQISSKSANYVDSGSIGSGSLSFGNHNLAYGIGSFAGGLDNNAKGQYAFAHGQYLLANKYGQYAFGKYNVEDTENNPLSVGSGYGRYVEMVGNGTSTTRSNARTLDWNGNEVLAGSSTATSFIKSGGTSSQFLKADGSVDSSSYATETYVDNAVGAIDQKQSFTFTATDARWSSTLVDGVYTLTFNASNTTGFVAGKIPLSCFNGDNEQVMATLGFTSTTVYIKSDTKFAGTIYMI